MLKISKNVRKVVRNSLSRLLNGVVQAHFGENQLHGTSVSGRIMDGFGTKDPGNERIGIVGFQRMSKNKNRLSIRKVSVR